MAFDSTAPAAFSLQGRSLPFVSSDRLAHSAGLELGGRGSTRRHVDGEGWC